MRDEELVEAFEQVTLPAAAFAHEAHVRVAWWYLGRYGLGGAIERFSGALRRFAATHGAPGRYHQTITVAYLLIIAERRHRDPDAPWPRFAAANADLFARQPSVLAQFYSDEVLQSELARVVFVMPTRS